MQSRRLLVLLAYVFAALLSVALTKEYTSDKRIHTGMSSFKTMMRYGRGGGGANNGKTLTVYPRASAFFLGPRYGKRSTSWSPNTSLAYSSSPLCANGMDLEELSCTYTGVADLYRCTQRKEAHSSEEFTATHN